MSPRPFILCADDYALSPGVTRGIIDALGKGRLNATGAMTNRPLWKEAAPDVAAFADRADIGLHLNLTFGAPLGPMPELAPSGLTQTKKETLALVPVPSFDWHPV